ncbi:hypothetical protein Hanom_Chr05g00390661 [Helianthus anomalus]
MPPKRIRGREKGPMRGGPSGHIPSRSHSSDHPQYSSESHSSQSARHSFSNHSSHSHHSHHSHQSHHSNSHYFHGSFDPNQLINSPLASQNQLRQHNQPDEDSDPEMPPSGSHMHPFELSSDTASYSNSPYQGPDEWDQYFNQFIFVYTPPYQPPMPPPPPPKDEPMEPAEPPQPPPQPRKPRVARDGDGETRALKCLYR